MAPASGHGPQRRAGSAGRRAIAFRVPQPASRREGRQSVLDLRQIAFRKTHDLADLGSQCAAADPSLEPILRKAEELTDYASAFRYPDAPYEPDAAEAAEALTIAVKLCTEVQRRIESAQKP